LEEHLLKVKPRVPPAAPWSDQHITRIEQHATHRHDTSLAASAQHRTKWAWSVLRSGLVERTIYEVMGGAEALLALAEAWHKRCLADPILSPPFEDEVHP